MLCGGCVYLPPARGYRFDTTLEIPASFRGCLLGGLAFPPDSVASQMPPTANLIGPAVGPVIQIRNSYHGVLLQNLALLGQTMGMYVGNSAGIRLVNVAASASVDSDHVHANPASACNNTGCNIILNSMVEPTSFTLARFGGGGSHGNHPFRG